MIGVEDMTRKDLEQFIWDVFDEARLLAKDKNADYASEEDGLKNFRGSLIINVPMEKAVLVRILDKITRIGNLLDRPNVVKGETINDSILDAINYLAILKAIVEDSQ